MIIGLEVYISGVQSSQSVKINFASVQALLNDVPLSEGAQKAFKFLQSTPLPGPMPNVMAAQPTLPPIQDLMKMFSSKMELNNGNGRDSTDDSLRSYLDVRINEMENRLKRYFDEKLNDVETRQQQKLDQILDAVTSKGIK